MTGIRGVRIAGGSEIVDIRIERGVIASITPSQENPEHPFVVLPGFVDLHTHLREPGGETSETIATGTRAAAAGGYTDVFAMANLTPVTDTVERVRDIRARAEGASARVHPIAAASVGLVGEELTDHEALAAEGVTVFSDDGKCLSADALVRETLARMARLGTVFAQHAQHPEIVGAGVINERVADAAGAPGWPVAGEEAIVARDIALAEETGGHLHVCHVSTAGTVELVRDAKRRGLPVTAEVTPHHLMVSDDDALERGPELKVNPPLRSGGDIEALRAALRDGTIDVIGTDHAPHPMETKRKPWTEAAFGLTALETALPIVAEVLTEGGVTDWDAVARVMSHTPALVGRIAEVAGRPVGVGEPATLCVVQPAGDWIVDAEQHYSLSRNTPFDGRAMRARVVATMIDGRLTHGSLAE
ncbi:dihydroorotase [Salinibacterium sp. dk2585]|uniref:dihydroorotase n=1 Tax=unclassified Salinibacterium TaxID=2632331 RepID=UPI0011C252E8|nr:MULTISPECIES: dihydroorotase [unclassified Salinibacterium]QEE62382.1 dihydroorotase [Salinibacterium sp. dk2585]TXK52735.1 dihydroorotase [Salinibacterium sp. dk5596]